MPPAEDHNYWYSFGVRDLPIGQIVNVARRRKYDPNAKWEDVGSYYSIKRKITARSAYNPGVNARYENMRNS